MWRRASRPAELRVQVSPYLQVMREHVVKYLSTNTPGEARASTSHTFINLKFFPAAT